MPKISCKGRTADGQGHHQADDDRAAGDDDRRIDGVTEIAPFHGVETGPDRPAIALSQVAFLLARVNRADIMDRFRNEFVRPAYGDAVVPLGLEHALLEIAGQDKQEGQADTEQYAQAQTQVEDDDEDAENREGIGNHADDAGIEEVFQGIDVVDEERCDSAGFMADEVRRRQFVEALAHG